MDNRYVVDHRRRCEPTLRPQMALVMAFEFSQRRGVTNRLRVRNDPLTLQMSKKLQGRRSLTSAQPPLHSQRAQEPIDKSLVELRNCEFLLF
jgi:hypothetical protein